MVPLVSMQTGKSIADIHWNCWASEEIAVSHEFSTEICIFDLGTVNNVEHEGFDSDSRNGENVWSAAQMNGNGNGNRSTRSTGTRPLHLLSVPSGQRSGGHTCLLSLELDSPVDASCMKKRQHSSRRCIIAGSSNGRIRMWDVPQNSASNGTIYPQWEVSADPLLGAAVSNSTVRFPSVIAVMHTFLMKVAKPTDFGGNNHYCSNITKNKGIVVAITTSGVFSYWDLNKLQSASFAAKSIPVSMRRVELWDFRYSSVVALPVTVRCDAVVRDVERYGGRLPDVIGVTKLNSCVSTIHEEDTLQYSITLSNSVVLVVDLNLELVLSSSRCAAPLLNTGSESSASESESVSESSSTATATEMLLTQGLGQTSVPVPGTVKVVEMLGKGILAAHSSVSSRLGRSETSCPSAMLSVSNDNVSRFHLS